MELQTMVSGLVCGDYWSLFLAIYRLNTRWCIALLLPYNSYILCDLVAPVAKEVVSPNPHSQTLPQTIIRNYISKYLFFYSNHPHNSIILIVRPRGCVFSKSSEFRKHRKLGELYPQLEYCILWSYSSTIHSVWVANNNNINLYRPLCLYFKLK